MSGKGSRVAIATLVAMAALGGSAQARPRQTLEMPDISGTSAVVAHHANREVMAGLFGPPSIDSPVEMDVVRHGSVLTGRIVVCAGNGQLHGRIRALRFQAPDGTRTYRLAVRWVGGTQAFAAARGSATGLGVQAPGSPLTAWTVSMHVTY